MKSRLIASLTPILLFAGLLFLPLGPASALPYSEGNAPICGNGMAINFNHNQEWQLPSWGDFPFAATDPGMPGPTSIGALPHRWPVIWNNITFGHTLPAFLSFVPENFRHSRISALSWLRIDSASDNAPTPVPEPATLLLLGIGLLGITRIYRKQP